MLSTVLKIHSTACLAMLEPGGRKSRPEPQETDEMSEQWNKRRDYSEDAVRRLSGSVHVEHSLARRGAERLRALLVTEPYVNTLGAMTGNQAMQQAKAGLTAR
jgi:isocitrate lyase